MPGLDPGIHAEVLRESHTSDNRRPPMRNSGIARDLKNTVVFLEIPNSQTTFER
jgi:hypothetical protein